MGALFQEHLERLEGVLQRLADAGLTLKPKKCALFKKEVKFLGHIVSAEGVLCDPEKIAAVKTWPAPKNTKQVRQFVGLTSYYRKFIRDYAKIAAPLHRLTEKSRPLRMVG